MAIATWQDVQTALGRPISDSTEQQRAEWWLDGAEAQIRARLGEVNLLDPGAVRYVEAEAVAARMSNPDNYASESIDDYTYRYGTETRQIVIQAEWWAMLSPQADGSSTRPGFEPDTAPSTLDWS
jgi:hypothetical protein